MPAPDLRINGECLKTLDIKDACRYLGYWGTGNGDMSAPREIVHGKARVARDLIKSHPLGVTPELSAEVFAQKGICASDSEARQPSSNGCRVSWRVCKKIGYAYKNAWHVPWSTANSVYSFPTVDGGHEFPLPSGLKSTYAGLAAARRPMHAA